MTPSTRISVEVSIESGASASRMLPRSRLTVRVLLCRLPTEPHAPLIPE